MKLKPKKLLTPLKNNYMNQEQLRKKAALRARSRKAPLPDTSKRLPLTEEMLPVKDWSVSNNAAADGYFSSSPDDAVNRGRKAEQAMMKRLEKTCWHCGSTYSPPLFSNEGRFFCSKQCSGSHVFSDEQQAQLQQNYAKEWQEMVTAGVFDNRQDLQHSIVEQW